MFPISVAVKEYAAECHISTQAVYARIRRKRSQLKGHVYKVDGKTVLDGYAQELLKPVGNLQLAEKADNLKKSLDSKTEETEKCNFEIERLNKKCAELTETVKSKNAEIDELKNTLSDKNAEIANLQKRISELTDKALNIEEYKENVDKVFSVLADSRNTGIVKKIENALKKA